MGLNIRLLTLIKGEIESALTCYLTNKRITQWKHLETYVMFMVKDS